MRLLIKDPSLIKMDATKVQSHNHTQKKNAVVYRRQSRASSQLIIKRGKNVCMQCLSEGGRVKKRKWRETCAPAREPVRTFFFQGFVKKDTHNTNRNDSDRHPFFFFCVCSHTQSLVPTQLFVNPDGIGKIIKKKQEVVAFFFLLQMCCPSQLLRIRLHRNNPLPYPPSFSPHPKKKTHTHTHKKNVLIYIYIYTNLHLRK